MEGAQKGVEEHESVGGFQSPIITHSFGLLCTVHCLSDGNDGQYHRNTAVQAEPCQAIYEIRHSRAWVFSVTP